ARSLLDLRPFRDGFATFPGRWFLVGLRGGKEDTPERVRGRRTTAEAWSPAPNKPSPTHRQRPDRRRTRPSVSPSNGRQRLRCLRAGIAGMPDPGLFRQAPFVTSARSCGRSSVRSITETWTAPLALGHLAYLRRAPAAATFGFAGVLSEPDSATPCG